MKPYPNIQTILITGASGLIGSRIVELLAPRFTFLTFRSQEVDITQSEAVLAYGTQHSFDAILHLAGYTNVDKAEQEPAVCHALNVTGTRNMLALSEAKGVPLYHISTDFVFDGYATSGTQPTFTEDSTPHPLSVYAKTKYEAEQLVSGKAMIVRPSYPYRASFEPKRDLVRTIAHLLATNTPIQAVEDSWITPTFIDDIAYNIEWLLGRFEPTIYHLVGSETLSPYEVASAIARVGGFDSSLITPTTYKHYFAGKAVRPQWSRIISTKSLAHPMRPFSQGLHAVTLT